MNAERLIETVSSRGREQGSPWTASPATTLLVAYQTLLETDRLNAAELAHVLGDDGSQTGSIRRFRPVRLWRPEVAAVEWAQLVDTIEVVSDTVLAANVESYVACGRSDDVGKPTTSTAWM